MIKARNDLGAMLKACSSPLNSHGSKEIIKCSRNQLSSDCVSHEVVKEDCSCRSGSSKSLKRINTRCIDTNHDLFSHQAEPSPIFSPKEVSTIFTYCDKKEVPPRELHNLSYTSEDLKWLGKNNSSKSKDIVPKKIYSTLYRETKPRQTHQREIYQTADLLLSRIQTHEEELRKRLAEMSMSNETVSVPDCGSNASCSHHLRRKMESPASNQGGSLQTSNIANQLPGYPCDIISIDSKEDYRPVSSNQSFSSLIDEWLENLVKAELEIE